MVRKPYHHGDLYETATMAARTLIEANGAEATSLRAVANQIGTTHRALYNHFADREALLAAVAASGYRDLTTALRPAIKARQHMQTYARFALDHPHLYRLMMQQSYEAFETVSNLRQAADALIDVSLNALATLPGSDDQRRRAVMRHWMLVHGGLDLHLSGVLRARSDAAFITEILAIAGLSEPDTNPQEQALWAHKKDPPDDK